jgi:hypothetical protein
MLHELPKQQGANMNEEPAAFESVDDDALTGVSGGVGPALYGAGVLAARAAPYVARGAQAAWRWVSGGEGVRGATHRAGALAEALSGDPSRSVMSKRPSLQPNPPAITRMVDKP